MSCSSATCGVNPRFNRPSPGCICPPRRPFIVQSEFGDPNQLAILTGSGSGPVTNDGLVQGVNPTHENFTQSKKFQYFLVVAAVIVMALIIRQMDKDIQDRRLRFSD